MPEVWSTWLLGHRHRPVRLTRRPAATSRAQTRARRSHRAGARTTRAIGMAWRRSNLTYARDDGQTRRRSAPAHGRTNCAHRVRACVPAENGERVGLGLGCVASRFPEVAVPAEWRMVAAVSEPVPLAVRLSLSGRLPWARPRVGLMRANLQIYLSVPCVVVCGSACFGVFRCRGCGCGVQ